MLSLILASLLAPKATVDIADQKLKFKLDIQGTFAAPLNIEDPKLYGTLDIRKHETEGKPTKEFRLRFEFLRKRNPQLEPIVSLMPNRTNDSSARKAVGKDETTFYLVNTFLFDPESYAMEPEHKEEFSPADQVLGPLALAVAMAQRTINKPELLKEYVLQIDEHKKFMVTFRQDLTSSTRPNSGDVGLKFAIKYQGPDGSFPSFFTGSLRLNSKTRLIEYFTATSNRDDQPGEPDLMLKKNYAIRMEQDAGK